MIHGTNESIAVDAYAIMIQYAIRLLVKISLQQIRRSVVIGADV